MQVAVVGSGPSGLMAADILASAGAKVTIFEKRKAIAWKLYVAGSSGLNISNNLGLSEFAKHYTGPQNFWDTCLGDFFTDDWISFLERDLGLGTFLGTSNRYFLQTMHAAKLVKLWRKRLTEIGVDFVLGHECTGFSKNADLLRLDFRPDLSRSFDAVCLALGGGSWEPQTSELNWPQNLFKKNGVGFKGFEPWNTGYEVAWPSQLLEEAEGLPINNITLKSPRGERQGDLVITAYGLEGTPIYFYGATGVVWLDLFPNLSQESLLERLCQSKENLSPIRRAKKYLHLSPSVHALLFHMSTPEQLTDLETFSQALKKFPLTLTKPRPLSESISSSGGVLWHELDRSLMLKKFPGIYCAGEMIDWDAPTGGFLIQGCVAQGALAARAILKRKPLA